MTDNSINIARYAARKGGWFHRLIRRLTRRFWKSQVRAVVDYGHERGIVNSHTYHELHAFVNEMIEANPKYISNKPKP